MSHSIPCVFDCSWRLPFNGIRARSDATPRQGGYQGFVCSWRNRETACCERWIHPGHESLDVTLAYLKGKDAESEEAQEHANSSSLALYA
jgi:hypothetical protein